MKNICGLFFAGLIIAVIYSCSSDSNSATTDALADPMKNRGIGPVSSVSTGTLDHTLAATGKSIFESKCTACHKIEVKHVGPALNGVTERRTPEWIMNMILNPTEMTQKDPIAKDLLATYMAPMANQNLTQDEARAVLEFFRSNDNN
ncbi:MAG: cytochrome c [Bacteroidetes bacterium]|nr:cytochrome c [Bacteroidota bacterium]